jgi:hypothetical protein
MPSQPPLQIQVSVTFAAVGERAAEAAIQDQDLAARWLVHRQRGDRRSRLVPRAAGHGVPWMPVAVAGFFGTLLALRRIPVVARALAAPGMVNRLELPHSFRVAEGTAFLAIMALGHLPALFALPAGLGDVAAGIAALLVARRLAQGGGRRAAVWLNAFGMTDLVVALTLAPSPDSRCSTSPRPARRSAVCRSR